MKGNFVRFLDAVEFVAPEVSDEVQDFYAKPENLQSTPLNIRIAATHAGKITRNHGFYLPSKMRDGAKTFTAQYAKPIQVHHDSKRDPIGRTLKATYVDLSPGFRDSIADSITVAKDKNLQDFIDGRLPMKDAVEFANEYFINDVAINSDPDYEGLGYIELVASITDADAIVKILDKRYLTGSTGASTNSATCSVCKVDWAADGKCEHRPGRVYDGAKCVLIAGDLAYDEYSFVNKPADRHSGVIEVNIGGIQDFVEVEAGVELNDTQPESNQVYELLLVQDSQKKDTKSQEDNQMTFKDAFEHVSQLDTFKGKEGLEDAVKQIVDENEDLTEETLVELVTKALEPADDAAGEGQQQNDDAGQQQDDVGENGGDFAYIRDFFGDDYAELIGEDEAEGRHYAEMLMTLLDGVETEEEKAADRKEIFDAKLTAAARKKLSGSSFCGPERSFPVNDCAHYTAALRLIGRYKGPGDKGRIRACIERKGKRLGCGSKKDDAAGEPQTTEYANPAYFDNFEDNEVLDMLKGLLQVIEDRGLDCGCPNAQDDARVAELETALEEAKKSGNPDEALQAELDETKTRLDASRKEIRYLHADIENLTNTVADSMSAVQGAQVRHITDLRVISGEDTDITKVSDELKEKSSSEITEILNDLGAKVDTKKIADTLNSGLSNTPEGGVEDPTVQLQDNTSNTDGQPTSKTLDGKTRNQVQLAYYQILNAHGENAAKNYLDSLRAEGYEIEDASAQK